MTRTVEPRTGQGEFTRCTRFHRMRLSPVSEKSRTDQRYNDWGHEDFRHKLISCCFEPSQAQRVTPQLYRHNTDGVTHHVDTVDRANSAVALE